MVRLHTDNKTVAKQLRGEWGVDRMWHHFDAARQAISSLKKLGLSVEVAKVGERHPHHRHAHQMSRTAWNQVFDNASWRPSGRQTGR